mgnify:CR=1 FL=1
MADYKDGEAGILPERLGRNHVYFLPYLMGERSPINDVNARGMFIGLTMDTTRADMLQAVLHRRLDGGIPPRSYHGQHSAAAAGSLLCRHHIQRNPVQAAVDELVSVTAAVEPDPALTALYEERYQQFREIYPACGVHMTGGIVQRSGVYLHHRPSRGEEAKTMHISQTAGLFMVLGTTFLTTVI